MRRGIACCSAAALLGRFLPRLGPLRQRERPLYFRGLAHCTPRPAPGAGPLVPLSRPSVTPSRCSGLRRPVRAPEIGRAATGPGLHGASAGALLPLFPAPLRAPWSVPAPLRAPWRPLRPGRRTASPRNPSRAAPTATPAPSGSGLERARERCRATRFLAARENLTSRTGNPWRGVRQTPSDPPEFPATAKGLGKIPNLRQTGT